MELLIGFEQRVMHFEGLATTGWGNLGHVGTLDERAKSGPDVVKLVLKASRTRDSSPFKLFDFQSQRCQVSVSLRDRSMS